MKLKLLLLFCLIIVMYLLIAIQGIVEIFSIKVVIASNPILQNGRLATPGDFSYWAPIALVQDRPISVLLTTVISIVTYLQPVHVILIPDGLIVTVLVTYLIASTVYRKTSSSLLLFSVSTSLLPYFTVTSYHSISMAYLLIFLYIVFIRGLLSRSFTYKNFVFGSVLLLNILLSHQYANGIVLMMLFIYAAIMSGLSVHKARKQRNLMYMLVVLTPFLISASLLEVYYLKDLELFSSFIEGSDPIALLIDNTVYTIAKVLKITPMEPPYHQKYADLFYEIFPLSKYQSLLEGTSKYLILTIGFLLSIYTFLRDKNDQQGYIDSKALAVFILSLCGGILGISLIYSVVYKGAVILYQFVALYVLSFTYILLYQLISKSFKNFTKLLLRAVLILIFILMLLNNTLFIVLNVDLAKKGIIPIISGDEIKQTALVIMTLTDISKLTVFADFATSSSMGFTIYSHNYTSQIIVMPLGEYTYLLDCSSYTEVSNIVKYTKLMVLTKKNLLYGMRGEVAQYYIPPNKICYKGFAEQYNQVIATSNLIFYYFP